MKEQDHENTHANTKHTGKPLKLKEVGECAGVSRSTVLRWLNLPPAMRLGHVKKNSLVMAWESQSRDFLRRHGLCTRAISML
jgi:predicted DNA-binding transcriptional regulator AlpA